MDKFEAEVVRTALREMFKGAYLDICTIRNCLKIANMIPIERDINALSVLHCIHWSAMSKELRKEVFDKVIGMFYSEGFNLKELDMSFNKNSGQFELKPERSKILKMIGR